MIRIPAFKSQFRVAITPPDLVFFIAESGYRVIQSHILCQIAPLMNGKRSVTEIAIHFKGTFDRTDIECALLLFEAEGFIVDRNASNEVALATRPPKLSILFPLTADESSALQRFTKSNYVNVVSYGKVPAKQFITTLKRHGVAISNEPAAYKIVLVDDYLHEELQFFNRIALKQKTPWMIVKPTGTVFWYGPVFSPHDSACWSCLAIRLKEKRRVDKFLQANGSIEIRGVVASVRHITNTALNFTVLQALKHFALQIKELVTFDSGEMKFERHTIIRRPECPACGSSASVFPPPVELKRNVAQEHRSSSDRFKHHISLRTGIVDEMRRFGDHPLIHAVMADHLFVPNLQKKDLLKRGLTQKSWGKGCTPEQAQTGALCEALERYSGVFRGNEFRVEKSEQELGEEAIPLHACLNFSKHQYANREQYNEPTLTDHDWVPVPLDSHQTIEWTPVWSLTNKAFRYLPTAYCYYGYPLPRNHQFCRADSNGNAAGETLEQAIFNGFLEVVERDCAAMWWFNRAVRPGVLIESFPSSYLHEVLSAYEKLNREIWALDLTNDFGIPCFAALSAQKSVSPREILMGLGAHFNPVTALKRAITEMNQFLAVRLTTTGPRQKNNRTRRGAASDGKYLRPDSASPMIKFKQYQNKLCDDPITNVQTCIDLAKERAMEIFVLDQTRIDVGIPVVKVIVPGMRQIWRRFAPGRLYDVPVRSGWLNRALTENELNRERFLI